MIKAPLTTLAADWSDYAQLIVVLGVFAVSGIGWVVKQIREAQMKQKARQLQARQQIPSATRNADVVDRRRQQLQELARRRQQQAQAANPNRQASTAQQQRPAQARPQASAQQSTSQQSPAQRAQLQRRQAQAAQQRRATQPQAARSTQTPARPPQIVRPSQRSSQEPRPTKRRVSADAKPSRASVEEIVELTPIKDMPTVLGVPLHKAFILKEILDKPVALRSTEEHPIGM